jgi:uncharacterized membrane protein
MPPTPYPDGPPALVMRIIRIAIAFPVLAFAAISWYLWRSGSRMPPLEPNNPAYGYVAYAVAVLIVMAMFFLRGRCAGAPARAQRATLTIAGWALGEGAAMMGVVIYFITGEPMRMLPGLAVLVMSLLLFPVPEDAPARS